MLYHWDIEPPQGQFPSNGRQATASLSVGQRCLERWKGGPPQLKYDEQKCPFHRKDAWIQASAVGEDSFCAPIVYLIYSGNSQSRTKSVLFLRMDLLDCMGQGCMSRRGQIVIRREKLLLFLLSPWHFFRDPHEKGGGIQQRNVEAKCIKRSTLVHMCITYVQPVDSMWVCTACFGM